MHVNNHPNSMLLRFSFACSGYSVQDRLDSQMGRQTVFSDAKEARIAEQCSSPKMEMAAQQHDSPQPTSANSRSLVERILIVESVEGDVFRGITLPDAPTFGRVFGGQLVGQALEAASKTVDSRKLIHSLHAHFILPGDTERPLYYQVQRLRNGKSFATRRVDALQNETIIFTLVASFQREEIGFEHQKVTMPSAPDPDRLPSMEELRKMHLTDPRLPRRNRNNMIISESTPWPIEIRFCEPANQTNCPASRMYWFRVNGKLPDDDAFHRFVVAYTSDMAFFSSYTVLHGQDLTSSSASLDHSMWFHRPVRADEWNLFVIFSPSAYNARGFVSGQMFNRRGELLVSLAQEGLLRRPRGTSDKFSRL